MNGAFYVGATGLRAQQRALDVTANNIANMNTPAFKRSEVRFSELVSTPYDPAGGLRIQGEDLSSTLQGVRTSTSSRVFTQGDLRQTGKPLDLAIDGDGFIELIGPGGQDALWRGGTLKVNADGYLAAANGMPLKGMISVPAEASTISIGRDGRVQAQIKGEAPAEIGRIDLVLPKDLSALTAQGEGLYHVENAADLVTVAAGEDGGGVLTQGSIEVSNVELSDEMVTLLLMQRAYSANAQVVQAGDQLMGIVNSLKR